MEDACALSAGQEVDQLVRSLAAKLPQSSLSDLQCPQCGSMLHDPWTLGSGRSVCARCVTRVPGEHVPPVANRLLDSLVKCCLPQSAGAANQRFEGNERFKQGQWQEAVDAYTAALELDATSSASFANRSIAQLKLNRRAEAIADARRAVELRPLWPKWHHRLAAALRAHEQHAQGMVPLLRAAAIEQEKASSLQPGTPVRIQGLQKAARHNGKTGQCLRFIDDLDRWEVQLQSGEVLRVKSDNIGAQDQNAANAKAEVVELMQAGHDLPELETLAFPAPPPPRRIPAEVLAASPSLRDDLDCCMCSSLICEPTVLPCGHCMCRDCVARLLDHALQQQPCCPLCRFNLMPLLRQVNLRARQHQLSGLRFAHGGAQLTVCDELARLLAAWFPEEYAKRVEEVRAPQSEWVPIFVCSLSAPFLPTGLHVFEPRYRLMMRRAVETNQRFGMCLPSDGDDDAGFASAGTMLFIDRFEQLPDGRSMIGTKGVSRFWVLKRGTQDGYATALIRPFEEDSQGFPTSDAFRDEALRIHMALEAFGEVSRTRNTGVLDELEHHLGPLPDIHSAQFVAHIGFYAAQFLNTLFRSHWAVGPELVFMQPEKQRWQALLRAFSSIQPLDSLFGAVHGPTSPTTPAQDAQPEARSSL